MAKGPYSRVYHVLMDEYPVVFASDSQLASFVRLLLTAEKFYPQWAPVTKRTAAYRALVSCGLILESVDAQRYTVKGLSAERERRSEPGRIGAAVRWHSERNAESMPVEKRREREEDEKGANASEELPAVFMGWKHKDPKPGLHDGHHGKDCIACFPAGAA